MSTLVEIFGKREDLSASQMALRAVVVFIIGLIQVRIAGRRAFGVREPFDNVMTILLGAILARAVVGASPFVPTITSATVIVLLHRMFGIFAVFNSTFGALVKGRRRVLYQNGKLHKRNMAWGMISERDLMKGVRTTVNMNTLENIDKIYLERDGKMSVILKQNNPEIHKQ
jgi:uncharacterized membrane protein YcaP (DUF421 family)